MKKTLLGIIITFFLISVSFSSALALNLKEENQQAIASYQQAKQEYLQAVAVYRQARQDFLTAKEKLEAARTAPQTKAVLEKAKDFMLKADQTAIKYLIMIRKKVEASSGLSERERQASLNEIDSDISWLTSKQAEISSATTKEELKNLASQVKNHWQNIRTKVKRITGQISAAKVNLVLTKLEETGNRVQAGIKKAKSAGRETSQLEAWFVDYQKNLNLAKEKYETAKTKFAAISNLEEANQLFDQGTAFIKEANQYLRLAHRNLKEIVKELKKP